MELITFVNKWLHLLSIIATTGGVLTMLFVVIPALGPETEEPSDRAKAIFRRYGIVSGFLWLVVIITGFVNFFIVSPHASKGYHMYLGMKTVLALFMFGVAMYMGHPSKKPGAGRNRTQLLTILAILTVIVVGLSACLNISRINGSGIDKPAVASGEIPR
jgi:putative copper export protein